ncbi:MAG: PDZ domain-containing protein [Methylophilaceae bacterium]
MRILISLVLMLGLAACADNQSKPIPAKDTLARTGNPYTDTFVLHTTPSVRLQPDPTGPKIFRGTTKENDYNSMLQQGYDMVGYSSFEAGNVAPELAAEQAKLIKADMVLVYTNVSDPNVSKVKVDKTNARALSPTGAGDARLTADGKVIDQDAHHYAYFASYWIKLAPPLIGVHVNGPIAGNEKAGLPILAVIQHSPADKAGLANGDILTKIGDVVLDAPEKLTSAAQLYAGKTVALSFSRAGVSRDTSITLNQ